MVEQTLSIGEAAQPSEQPEARPDTGLWPITGYFLKLGTIGFGGPAALVGYMHRDLVERRRWIEEETYQLALALSQIMPGPLAAQSRWWATCTATWSSGGVVSPRPNTRKV